MEYAYVNRHWENRTYPQFELGEAIHQNCYGKIHEFQRGRTLILHSILCTLKYDLETTTKPFLRIFNQCH